MLSDALGVFNPRASFVSRQSQTADRLRVQELENCYESKSDIRKKTRRLIENTVAAIGNTDALIEKRELRPFRRVLSLLAFKDLESSSDNDPCNPMLQC